MYTEPLLLEGVQPSSLPDALQPLLQPDVPIPEHVDYIEAHIPGHPLWYVAWSLLCACATVWFCGVGFIETMRGTLQTSYTALFVLFTLGLGLCTMWMVASFHTAKRARQPYEEGRMRHGFYLLDNALLEYDGDRVWLIPATHITSVIKQRMPNSPSIQHRVHYLDSNQQPVRHHLPVGDADVLAMQAWFEETTGPIQ